MNALYDLRDMLCAQLEEYGKKGELSASVLDKVDTLAHATKNLDKIIDKCECEESDDMESYSSRKHSSRRSHSSSRRSRSNNGFGSGRYYSGDDDDEEENDLVEQVYAMIDKTTDEQTRKDLKRFADKMEQVR